MRRLLTTRRRLAGQLRAAHRRIRQQDHLIAVVIRRNGALAGQLAAETRRNRLLAKRIDDLTTRTEAGSTTS